MQSCSEINLKTVILLFSCQWRTVAASTPRVDISYSIGNMLNFVLQCLLHYAAVWKKRVSD
jgi:hypothetical protein